jgi:hypothetical protein
MAEPWLGIVEKVTEFFATAQIETCARRTGFVRRSSKVTAHLGRTLPSQERRRSQRQERRSWAFAGCCRAGRRQVVQHVAALLA